MNGLESVTKPLRWFMAVLLLALAAGCGGGGGGSQDAVLGNLSGAAALTAKAITSYSLNGIAGVVIEGTTPKTITVIMPSGTNLALPLTATYVTTGSSVSVAGLAQVSGTTTNVFTQGTPKVYTVTAVDGSTAAYNINVSVALTSDKALTSYSLNGIAGVISEATTPKTITVIMPSGTNMALPLTATYLTTGTSVSVAGVPQVSGTTTNVFTQGTPKVYTVTAADGSGPASYNVNVSVALTSDKALTSYSLNGIAGVISEATTPKTITVIMPSGTNLALPLTATYLTTGTSVSVAGVPQVSGTTTNVFTQGTPKVYTVTAADGSGPANYNVNVSVALTSDKALTSYSLNGIAGVISEGTTPKTITVIMPSGTDLTLPLTATYLTTGTSVSVGGVAQVSGLPPTNVFTPGTPKVYTVTAADGSGPASYNVNVSVALASDKALISYSLNGIAGVISEGTTPKTITVIMPSGTNLALPLTATYLTTGTSVSVAGVAQVSGLPPTNVFTQGTPKVYTVTAADGSGPASYNVNVSVAQASDKALTSYSLNGIAGVISEGTTPKTITVIMPSGTNLALPLTATYLTTGTSVLVNGLAQVSGTTGNVFIQGTPKVYTVTAQDGSGPASYNVNVSVAQASDKALTSYSLNGIAGVISEGTTPKTITVIMPSGTNLALPLTATYLTTGTSVLVAGVAQVSGLPPTNVFTQGTPKVYTVTAADGSAPASYNVNVSVALASDKALTSYSLNGIAGVISEATTPKTISVIMPSGTDLTLPLTATYLTTGTSVLVAGVAQVSGLPPTNVFTQGTPKVYTVTAADGSGPASYDVNVSVALTSDKAITSYSLNGIAGVINEGVTPKTITVIMPSGTDLALPLTATYLTTGTSVLVNGLPQVSGLPPTNVFAEGTPKVYTVTAADGSGPASYNVNVSVAPTIPGPAGAAPNFKTAATYGIMAWDAITINLGSHIYGDVALPGGVTASVTGTGGVKDSGVAPHLKSSAVTNGAGVAPGEINTTDNGTLTPTQLTQLQTDLKSVYDDLFARAAPVTPLATIAAAAGVPGGTFPAAAPDLSGYVLSPGIYTTTGTYGLSNTLGPLVLDAGGNADAVFIIRSTGSGISGLTSTTGSVVLQGGAQPKNVFWLVDNATIGANTFFQGTIVAGHVITLNDHANVEGRMLAGALGLVSGAITLTGTNIITVPK